MPFCFCLHVVHFTSFPLLSSHCKVNVSVVILNLYLNTFWQTFESILVLNLKSIFYFDLSYLFKLFFLNSRFCLAWAFGCCFQQRCFEILLESLRIVNILYQKKNDKLSINYFCYFKIVFSFKALALSYCFHIAMWCQQFLFEKDIALTFASVSCASGFNLIYFTVSFQSNTWQPWKLTHFFPSTSTTDMLHISFLILCVARWLE